MLGFQSSPKKHLAEMDIFLSTSLYEGMPYSLIEALSYKVPIVASNVIGNNEIVKHGYNGYLYELGNVEQATEYIFNLVNDVESYKDFSVNSGEVFLEKFSVDKMIGSYIELYNEN